jgi:endonuclease YncB( thermonuclease family)
MRTFKARGFVLLAALGAIALLNYLNPRLLDQALKSAVKAVEPELVVDSGPMSEYYQIVEGSIYDGDTLRVTDGKSETKLRFCGVDAPEKDQAGGIESRDHLRSLIARGDGSVIVVPVETDRYGRTVAELFIPVGGEEEIHLNSQMVLDGHAYHYARYSSTCPNKDAIVRAEESAKAQFIGLWANPQAERPWDYRKRS